MGRIEKKKNRMRKRRMGSGSALRWEKGGCKPIMGEGWASLARTKTGGPRRKRHQKRCFGDVGSSGGHYTRKKKEREKGERRKTRGEGGLPV